MTDAALPQSEEAEHALVGSLLLDRDAIAAVDWLPPTAIASYRARAIFSAVLDLWKQRIPADFTLVVDRLVSAGMLDEIGGPAAVSAFVTAEVTPAHVEYYARRVAHYAKVRVWLGFTERVAKGFYADDEGFDPTPYFQAAQEAVESLDDPSLRSGPVAYADLIDAHRDEILRSWDGEIVDDSLPTGFRWLDDGLGGGLRPAELTILAARPSMGKTAMMLQLVHNAARNRRERGSVVVFSAEMSTRSLMFRALSEVSGVPIPQIRTGKIPHDLRERVLAATDRLAEMPVLIDDTSGITTAQMIARVQRLQREGPVSLVVFDYIELAGDEDPSEEKRVGRIGAQLKHLAKVCSVPVVALCQLSRAVEQRKDRRPMMSDLRYSGSLEAHADVILFLYRMGYYVAQGLMDAEPGKEDVTDVIVAKQRNGMTGTYPVRWWPAQMAFSDLDEDRTLTWGR